MTKERRSRRETIGFPLWRSPGRGCGQIHRPLGFIAAAILDHLRWRGSRMTKLR
jgi:hypothetical protein